VSEINEHQAIDVCKMANTRLENEVLQPLCDCKNMRRSGFFFCLLNIGRCEVPECRFEIKKFLIELIIVTNNIAHSVYGQCDNI
jgi:hypothetical protein